MHETTRKINRRNLLKPTKNVGNYWVVITEMVDKCDIILEVLDARMPDLSRNELLESMVLGKGKELIFVLNKADLVGKKFLVNTRKELRKSADCVYVSSTSDYDLTKLKKVIFGRVKNFKKLFGRLHVGIVGYPNTGKSSLANALIKKSRANVSSKAGTTHGVQWVRFGENVLLMDSPGVLPFDRSSKLDQVREGLIGARDPERLKNPDDVAYEIIRNFLSRGNLGREVLERFFSIDIQKDVEDPEVVLQMIAKKLNFLKKGGVWDEHRTSASVIRSWTSGKLKL